MLFCPDFVFRGALLRLLFFIFGSGQAASSHRKGGDMADGRVLLMVYVSSMGGVRLSILFCGREGQEESRNLLGVRILKKTAHVLLQLPSLCGFHFLFGKACHG